MHANNANSTSSYYYEKKYLKSNERRNYDWNCSYIDNLVHRYGYEEAKIVSIEMFLEAINYIEKRLNNMEERIEDNEQMIRLSDRLFDLRSFPRESSPSLKNKNLSE